MTHPAVTTLDDAVARVKDRSSLLWACRPDDCQETDTVEVRLNGTEDQAAAFVPPDDWTLHRVQWGDTLFIRRRQPMDEASIEAMLCDMLRFAETARLRFWSWQAGADRLAPDGFHPDPPRRRRR